MRNIHQIALTVCVAIIVILIGVTSVYFLTNGDYKVASTTADDLSLPRLTVRGYRFHAETFGNPTDQALIVLHGGPGGDYQSLLSLRALSDRYHTVFYDQRGAGLSERVPTESLSLAANIADLDTFIDHYGNGRPVILVEHSWGAMLLAAYLGHAPDKVERAVLMEPGSFNAEEQHAWQARANQLQSGVEYFLQAVIAGFQAQHVNGPDEQASKDYMIERMITLFVNRADNPYHCQGKPYNAPLRRFGSTAYSAIFDKASNSDFNLIGTGARKFNKPVLLLAGACDSWIGPELQKKHLAYFRDAKMQIIPDSAHDMVWDKPSATVEAIRAFLD
jgi:proline iminopeptidase